MDVGQSTASPEVVVISPQREEIGHAPPASATIDAPITNVDKEMKGDRHEEEHQEMDPLVDP